MAVNNEIGVIQPVADIGTLKFSVSVMNQYISAMNNRCIFLPEHVTISPIPLFRPGPTVSIACIC